MCFDEMACESQNTETSLKEDMSDWQLKCRALNECAGRLLKMQQWTDCSFLVGANEVVVRAHKLVLAMVSPVFEAMFYGPLAETGPVRIPDMEPIAFNAMLEYIYTDNIDVTSYILAIDLIHGAHKYLVPRLQAVCTKYLSRNLTPEIVCRVYELALLIEDDKLMANCEQVIRSEPVLTFISDTFLKLNLDTVVKIFTFPMVVENELELVQAAEQYNKELKAQSVDSDPSLDFLDDLQDLVRSKSSDTFEATKPSVALRDTEERVQVKKEVQGNRPILKVLRQIRFLSLTPQQLGETKSLCSLLTSDELAAILVNAVAADGKASMAMPDGFSTNRIRRGAVTDEQRKYLRQNNKESFIATFSSKMSKLLYSPEKKKHMDEWNKLKAVLDGLGPPLTIDQWKIELLDLEPVQMTSVQRALW